MKTQGMDTLKCEYYLKNSVPKKIFDAEQPPLPFACRFHLKEASNQLVCPINKCLIVQVGTSKSHTISTDTPIKPVTNTFKPEITTLKPEKRCPKYSEVKNTIEDQNNDDQDRNRRSAEQFVEVLEIHFLPQTSRYVVSLSRLLLKQLFQQWMIFILLFFSILFLTTIFHL